MIKEAARCSDGEDVNLDIDDVIEFIGDAVPPLMPVSTCTRQTTEAPCKLPQLVMDMLDKLVQWIKNKKKYEVIFIVPVIEVFQ